MYYQLPLSDIKKDEMLISLLITQALDLTWRLSVLVLVSQMTPNEFSGDD